MKPILLAATILCAGLGLARAQDTLPSVSNQTANENAGLLDFDWSSPEQKQRVEAAHQALADADREMCDVMVDVYAEHVTRLSEADSLPNEVTGFFKRRCQATAFADHIAQSISLHEALHQHGGAHASHDHDGSSGSGSPSGSDAN